MKKSQTIANLNRQPINQIAETALWPDWVNPSVLHVLAPAQWRLDQGVVRSDEIESFVTWLLRIDPARALDFVQQTDASDLGLELDPVAPLEQNALLVLEPVACRMSTI